MKYIPNDTHTLVGWGASFNVVACLIHPKLRNINPHNVSHSLIFRNPRERMFIVQILLLIVTFFSLISQFFSIMQTTKEVNSHPRIAPCVNMWSVTLFLFLFLFFSFFLCHLLNVGACICHIAWEGQVEWTTPHHEDVALCVIPWCHMLHWFYSFTHPC
jgi:uncharacterized membrane protein